MEEINFINGCLGDGQSSASAALQLALIRSVAALRLCRFTSSIQSERA